MNQLSRNRKIMLFGTPIAMSAAVLLRSGMPGGGRGAVAASHDSTPVAPQRLEILRPESAAAPAQEAVTGRATRRYPAR
jgi:hypothetical protein